MVLNQSSNHQLRFNTYQSKFLGTCGVLVTCCPVRIVSSLQILKGREWRNSRSITVLHYT
ncbi:hypothetical protein BDZ91DRAFT_709574 [Kalaharituber pfeilii]|nr:hypothetical protein BDZ91DRAFT_709574 [Kalaharituber pfeilii]